MEKIRINNLSVVECKLIKQLNKEDHVVCFKWLCLLQGQDSHQTASDLTLPPPWYYQSKLSALWWSTVIISGGSAVQQIQYNASTICHLKYPSGPIFKSPKKQVRLILIPVLTQHIKKKKYRFNMESKSIISTWTRYKNYWAIWCSLFFFPNEVFKIWCEFCS